MNDLILEIGTEELPASVFSNNGPIVQLKEIAAETFAANNLGQPEIATFGTPRRMVLFVKKLQQSQDGTITEIKGPPAKISFQDGKPTKAAIGFANSIGMKPGDLVVKKADGGEYVFAVKKEPGKKSTDLLPEILPIIIRLIKFEKTMRWRNELHFSRPIRWIMAMYGNKTIKFSLDGLQSTNITYIVYYRRVQLRSSKRRNI
jgi:glycyl-tRNA synthetase beta chain